MPRRISQQEAVKRCRAKGWEPAQGWQYTKNNLPIPGHCLVCGFRTDRGPRLDHLARQGACRQCAGRARLSDEQVIARCRAKFWEPDLPLNYGGNKARIPGTCMKCGTWGEGPTINGLIRQGACSGDCQPNRKKTHAEAVAKCLEFGWQPKAGWTYQGAHEPIPGSCLRCGWTTDDRGPRLAGLGDPRNKRACWNCAGTRPTTTEEALEDLRAANFEPDPGWQIEGNHTPVPGHCTICGSPGSPTVSSIRAGQGACSGDCQPNRKKTHDEAVDICHEKGWDPDVGWQYVDRDQRIPGTCMKCGKRSKGPRLGSLLGGQGACAACGHSWDRDKSGYLYVLWHPELLAWQFGRTQSFKKRVERHQASGFDIENVAFVKAAGGWIEDIEDNLKGFVTAPGFPQWKALGHKQFVGFGYTETFASRSYGPEGWTPDGIEDGDTQAMLDWFISDQVARDSRLAGLKPTPRSTRS